MSSKKYTCSICQKTFLSSPALRGHFGHHIENEITQQKRSNTIKVKTLIKNLTIQKQYEQDPKMCPHCNLPIPWFKRNNKFCSNSCRATFNNLQREKSIYEKSSKALSETLSKKPKKNFPQCKVHFKQCRICNEFFLSKSSSHEICKNLHCHKTKKDYYTRCSFKFNVYEYPDYFDLFLIESFGWYSSGFVKNKPLNINGISRDHIFPISLGFKLKIDPYLISHPANCQLLPHKENQSKGSKLTISIDDLRERIIEFEAKYSK